MKEREDRYKTLMRELDQQKIHSYRIWGGIRNREKPWMGISQSHKAIVQHALEKDLPYILIAEDDIKFTSVNSMNYFLTCAPPSYDLYLGGITSGIIKDDNRVTDFSGLTLYSINRKFYRRFLSIPETSNIDRLLQLENGDFFVCNPMVVTQYDGYSDNRHEYCEYGRLFQEKVFLI